MSRTEILKVSTNSQKKKKVRGDIASETSVCVAKTTLKRVLFCEDVDLVNCHSIRSCSVLL